MISTPLLLALALAATSASAQTTSASSNTATITSRPTTTAAAVSTPAGSPLPLTEYFYPYSAQPNVVYPFQIGRGPQSGYNNCNSTDSPTALCQTAVVNSISDFCLWGAPGTAAQLETIGDVEAAVVAYCSRMGHGARIFPPGTFTAVQFMKTPAYIQVVGLFNQTSINLTPTDTGGELDPHGADLAGNPLGGLVYSTGFKNGDNKTYVQTQSWNNFVGGNAFCFKLCDPSYSTTLNFCQNIYDLIGCAYNMPAAYAPGQFLSCEGELQDEVGTYTSNGQTFTWSQPETLAPGTTLPWTPRIPASSNCVTYASSDLFPLSQLGYQSTTSARTTAASSSQTGSGSGSASRTGSGSATVSATGAASSTAAKSAGREVVGVDGAWVGVMVGVVGVLVGALMV